MVDGQRALRSVLPNGHKTAILRPMAPGPDNPSAVPRVLLVEESLPFRRVIREALTAFRHCEVDDTPSAEHAFEMALKKEYALFKNASGSKIFWSGNSRKYTATCSNSVMASRCS